MQQVYIMHSEIAIDGSYIGLQMGNAMSGIPLSQFLVHSWHQDSTEMVDDEIAKLLIIKESLSDNFLLFAEYQSEDSLSGIMNKINVVCFYTTIVVKGNY